MVVPIVRTKLSETLLKLAVSWTVVVTLTAVAVAWKITLLAPGGTDTNPGTLTLGLLLESPTVTPPLGAEDVRLTVQPLALGGVTTAGLQLNWLRAGTCWD